MRRVWIALAALVALAGTLSAARAETPMPPAAGKLVLEDFFRGRLSAEGVFRNTRDNTSRSLKVKMHGTWDGTTLTLVEDFVFSDGEKDRKTWRFTKVADGVYRGTREDVIGEADVRQAGDDVRLSYTAKVKTKDGSTYDIRFDDLLRLTDKRTVLNTATLKAFWFFPVGNVELYIRKAGR
jgi:hypothetical protein